MQMSEGIEMENKVKRVRETDKEIWREEYTKKTKEISNRSNDA